MNIEKAGEVNDAINELEVSESGGESEIDLDSILKERDEYRDLLDKSKKDFQKKIKDLENQIKISRSTEYEKAKQELEQGYIEKFNKFSEKLRSTNLERLIKNYGSDFNEDVSELVISKISPLLDYSEDGDILSNSEEIKKHFKTIAEKYPSLVKMKQDAKKGTGTVDPEGKTPSGGLPRDFGTWSKKQQIEFYLKNPDLRKEALKGY